MHPQSKMSVDKFGRISSSSSSLRSLMSKSVRGERGVGFNLTVDGNYDMQMKNLKNINNPVDVHDAATKKYVDDGIGNIHKELMNNKEADKSRFLKRKLDVDENFRKISKEVSSQKEYIETVNAAKRQYIDEQLEKLYKELAEIHVEYTPLSSLR